MNKPFILASQSAIRAELLARAGIPVEVVPAMVDERALEAPAVAAGAGPDAVAKLLAAAKAAEVSARYPDHVVIGADQTLALGRERFSKARSREDAHMRLKRLSGQTHTLHAGFAVVLASQTLASGVAHADLTMRALDDADIEAYLVQAGDVILSSVGCYQLEGLGVRLFSKIEGDYFTILGLPLLPLLASLRALELMDRP